MTALLWSEQLALQHTQMDATHQEFVDLLASADEALAGPEPELLVRFLALVEHTVEHFAQEDRWMAATGFSPENCHAFQHQAVLNVMMECAQRAEQAQDFEPLRVAVRELAIWFPHHAQMMDASLAQHMAQVGFDAATGQLLAPREGDALITGCGGGSCA
jgi:hemerythrin